MTKIEYLQGLIERTDNWYHKHIYQTQLNRLLDRSPHLHLQHGRQRQDHLRNRCIKGDQMGTGTRRER